MRIRKRDEKRIVTIQEKLVWHRNIIIMKSTSSLGRTSSRLSNYSRTFDLPEDDQDGSETVSDCEIGGAMLPIFLNDLRRNNQDELVEVTLELENDSIVVCSVNPNRRGMSTQSTPGGGAAARVLERSLSATSRIGRKFGWLRSRSSRTTWSENEERAISARDVRRLKAKHDRSKLSTQRGLKGLRFISKTTGTSESNELWKRVESRFKSLAKDGLLAREDFGECIGKKLLVMTNNLIKLCLSLRTYVSDMLWEQLCQEWWIRRISRCVYLMP